MKVKYLEVKQPIGNFYLCSIEASVLAKVTEIKHRGDHPDSIQREESKSRVKDISAYCGDSDATFPTPIIVAINENANVSIDETHIHFDANSIIGEVIDGQHRLAGLKVSEYIDDFQLSVVFMFELLPSQKAYVFSIINSKQTRVNMSLIYDLFALSEKRSPYKTCHEIARALNKDYDSPFHKRLKMLGKKEGDQYLASISQGTFIKYLLELITKDPDSNTRDIKKNIELKPNEKLPLRQYFINEKDNVIHKVILNLFKAVSIAFEKEWNNPSEYILSKSIGFGAIIKAFPELYKAGSEANNLSEEFFISVFARIQNDFASKGLEITSANYGSNEQARTKLAKDFITSLHA